MGKSIKKRTIVIIVTLLVLIGALALIIGLILGLKKDDNFIQENLRIDCFPEEKWNDWTINEKNCTARGCCWYLTDIAQAPHCFLCPSGYLGAGYKAELESTTAESVKYNLRRSSTKSQAASEWISPSDGRFEVEYWGENIIRFKLFPSINLPRYEVPRRVLSLRKPGGGGGNQANRKYAIKVTSRDPFSFQIVRVSTNAIVFDTTVGGLILADQFLTISTMLPSGNIYGFGENTHKTFKHNLTFTSWPLFARDQPVGGIRNHYGVHPMYTCLENDGNSHGVFLLNSNAMDYSFTPEPMLTYRTIGGVLDFYIMLGPTPENVIQQYTELVGRPYMPPYWALGFQLCRYGYNSLENLRAAVERTRNASIPLDVQYVDIDHYEERMVFTVDNVAFAGLKEYFQSLRNEGLRTIIILDPCIITNVTGYEPFEKGLQRDAFVKWPNSDVMPRDDYIVTNSTALLGYVWPKGKVVFPDYLRNVTEDLWAELIQNHHHLVPFDGLWIDMNEPANFDTNFERPWNWPEEAKPYWNLHCPVGPLDDPKYTTLATYAYDREVIERGRPEGARLSDKTICMIAVQGEGAKVGGAAPTTGELYNHYDVHNLYGTSQIPSTLRGLRMAQPGQRGLVVGRSTFPGSGHLSGHWLGDNYSDWPNMRESIIGTLEFNLFGIPYVGPDICGFFGDTTDQLCRRWMQLGAFFPYARNHNTLDSKKEQDPGSLSELGQHLSREALLTRYALLPYLYTLFHIAHTQGNTVVRPVHHEFPRDSIAWGLDQQFLWGDSLMIVPILYENQTSLEYYLPGATWYDFYTNGLASTSDSGSRFQKDVTDDSPVSLFVRGGIVIPTQDPAVTTDQSRRKDFQFKAYLNSDHNAKGVLFWDDGVSIDTYETGQYYLAHLNATDDNFTLTIQHNQVPEVASLSIASVYIAGLQEEPVKVLLNCTETTHFSYNPEIKVLTVNNITSTLSENIEIKWSSSEDFVCN